eukprot:s449_g39.t1
MDIACFFPLLSWLWSLPLAVDAFKLLDVGPPRTRTQSMYDVMKILGLNPLHTGYEYSVRPALCGYLFANGSLDDALAVFDGYDAAMDEPVMLGYCTKRLWQRFLEQSFCLPSLIQRAGSATLLRQDPDVEGFRELKAAKEKWEELKLGKAKKEAATFPFPVWAMLALQQPPAAKAFDVYEIPVKLVINAVEPVELKVEVLILVASGRKSLDFPIFP